MGEKGMCPVRGMSMTARLRGPIYAVLLCPRQITPV